MNDFISELDQIESIFHRCRGDRTVNGFSLPYTPTEEGCLFAMWDAWTRYLRSLTIASSAASVLGLSGSTYTPPVQRTEAQVLAFLVANKKGRNFGVVNGEPKWNNSACLADILNALALPNDQTIISAVTASTVVLGPVVIDSPLEEVRIARNFAAHKNPSTLADIQTYSPTAFSSLTHHIRGTRSGVEAFSEWKESFCALAEAAAQ